MTVTLTDSLKSSFKENSIIMNPQLIQKYTPSQQLDLNLVHLFLQVITLSDMTEIDGANVCPHHFLGQLRPNQHIKRGTWPRQQEVTGSQTKLWKNYIASNFL